MQRFVWFILPVAIPESWFTSFYWLQGQDVIGIYVLKGYLVNWDVERQVWEHMFGKNGIQVCRMFLSECNRSGFYLEPVLLTFVICQVLI